MHVCNNSKHTDIYKLPVNRLTFPSLLTLPSPRGLLGSVSSLSFSFQTVFINCTKRDLDTDRDMDRYIELKIEI